MLDFIVQHSHAFVAGIVFTLVCQKAGSWLQRKGEALSKNPWGPQS